MAPPASSRALTRLAFTFLLAALNFNTPAATFPLPIPTRPTSFPLQRPTQAGEVVAWGTNNFGQITVPPNLTNVVAVGASENYTVALKADGTLVAWGQSWAGQTNVPSGLKDVVAIATGAEQVLALRSDGTVVGWGSNDRGAAAPPGGLSSVVAVAAGNGYSLALKSNGTVVAWGSQPFSIPARATNIVYIAGTRDVPIFVQSDGSLMQFDSTPGGNFLLMTGVVAASVAGSYHGEALRADGGVIAAYNMDTPIGLRAVAIASGSFHTVAITGEGAVVAWGDNLGGQTSVPPRLRNVISIAAGAYHSVAVKLPSPPIPTTALASAQIANGFIIGLNIIDGGEGYDVPPKVTITGGGGSGATATAQISRGIVTNFTMISAGSGYTSQPTITIDPPPFLPKLSIAPSRVNVVLQVVPGKHYQLESSDDLPNFSPIGSSFTATSNTLTNEFTLSDTGQFFRIQEIP